MNNSQDSKKRTQIQDITSIKQLLASYLVAESIIEIREERKSELEVLGEERLPVLNVDDSRYQKLYHDFSSLVNFNFVYVTLAKIGLEDMIKYKFADDPSVMVSAGVDTSHLNDKFGASFTILKETNLEDHTLRVFNNAIEIGKSKGRVMQISTAILGALFHDFGKCELLRKDILGDAQRPGSYKAHADVSGMYIREILGHKYFELTNENPPQAIESLYHCVANHHPKDRRLQSDTLISLINIADMKAREVEFKANRYKNK